MKQTILFLIGFFCLTPFAYSVGVVDRPQSIKAEGKQDTSVLLAKKAKASANKDSKDDQSAAGRKKILTGEARYKASGKRNETTSIDFDEASIDGMRRAPAGVAITKSRPDQDYDLIHLRLRWHPEMIQSTSNLETGRGK